MIPVPRSIVSPDYFGNFKNQFVFSLLVFSLVSTSSRGDKQKRLWKPYTVKVTVLSLLSQVTTCSSSFTSSRSLVLVEPNRPRHLQPPYRHILSHWTTREQSQQVEKGSLRATRGTHSSVPKVTRGQQEIVRTTTYLLSLCKSWGKVSFAHSIIQIGLLYGNFFNYSSLKTHAKRIYGTFKPRKLNTFY